MGTGCLKQVNIAYGDRLSETDKHQSILGCSGGYLGVRILDYGINMQCHSNCPSYYLYLSTLGLVSSTLGMVTYMWIKNASKCKQTNQQGICVLKQHVLSNEFT